ncbi:MAG: amino acid ABC transporter substrate-binding protein [Rhodospirillaceae bacterium]|nr:amino acid ABC transporter substrate-binding protein [Rhodospirillaceae bacterium]
MARSTPASRQHHFSFWAATASLVVAIMLPGAGTATAQDTPSESAPSGGSCARLVASGNPDYPPYLWRDPSDEKQLIGANAELMAKLAKEIGIPIEVRYIGSWARVQEEMREGRIDLIAGAFLTTQRLDYMDYVYPSIATTRSVVITLPDSPLDFKTWPDLVGQAGLTVINNSFGEEFDRYARENLAIDEVPKLESALRMLALGRADYVIYEDAPALAYAAQLGIGEIREAENAISNENLYLTLSHRSPCNSPALRGRLAQAMLKFAQEGTMTELIDAAVQAWRAQ